jgi:hypothetical protein
MVAFNAEDADAMRKRWFNFFIVVQDKLKHNNVIRICDLSNSPLAPLTAQLAQTIARASTSAP